MVTVWTSDFMSPGTYFLWEAKNVKYRLEMGRGRLWIPRDQIKMYRGTLDYDRYFPVRFTRFKNDPHVNASSFAIYSESQIAPFPMPIYQNKSPKLEDDDHLSLIPQEYNEIKWKEVSSASDGDLSIETAWKDLNGNPHQKKLTGQSEISAFYKKLNDLIATTPAAAVPQFIDGLFDGDRLLLTKGNLREMQQDITESIKAWKSRQAGTAPAATPVVISSAAPEKPESFVGNGPQGQASFDFSKNGGSFTIKNGVDEFHTKWGRRSMYQVNAAAGMAGKIGGQSGLTTLPTPAAAKLMDFTKPSRVVSEGDVVVFRNVQGKFVAVKLMNIEDSVHGGSQDRLTIRWKVLQP